MNKAETAAILAIIKTAYPNFYKNADEIDSAINLWATMFANDSAKVVTEAVKALMCTLKFPPTIADVKEKIVLITQPAQLSEMEAWQLVKRAVQGYSVYDPENNKRIFNELPPAVQHVIGSPSQLREWGQMDVETMNSVVQSNFMRSYRAVAAQEKEREMLPESTRELISGLAKKMSLANGSDSK